MHLFPISKPIPFANQGPTLFYGHDGSCGKHLINAQGHWAQNINILGAECTNPHRFLIDGCALPKVVQCQATMLPGFIYRTGPTASGIIPRPYILPYISNNLPMSRLANGAHNLYFWLPAFLLLAIFNVLILKIKKWAQISWRFAWQEWPPMLYTPMATTTWITSSGLVANGVATINAMSIKSPLLCHFIYYYITMLAISQIHAK